jgi:hypothetical protein
LSPRRAYLNESSPAKPGLDVYPTRPPDTTTVPFLAALTSDVDSVGPRLFRTLMPQRRPLVANMYPVTVWPSIVLMRGTRHASASGADKATIANASKQSFILIFEYRS